MTNAKLTDHVCWGDLRERRSDHPGEAPGDLWSFLDDDEIALSMIAIARMLRVLQRERRRGLSPEIIFEPEKVRVKSDLQHLRVRAGGGPSFE
jgi:hypothetical protein